MTLLWLEAHTLPMRRTVLSTFLIVAILGLGCIGVSAPGKAEKLEHPIVLQSKCQEHFEKYLDRIQHHNFYYSSWAYVSGPRGYACAWGLDDGQAIERCNENKRGECKVYAKSPVNGKVAIVWEEDENRYTSPKVTAEKSPSPTSRNRALPACPSDQDQYRNNCFGTHTYPSGSKYVGKYRDHSPNGQGTYTFANGNNTSVNGRVTSSTDRASIPMPMVG